MLTIPVRCVVGLIGLSLVAGAPAARPEPKVARLDREKMTEIDGTARQADGLRMRPQSAQENHSTLLVENHYIHDITDFKGIHVTSTSTDRPKIEGHFPTYKQVVIRNCEIGPVTLTKRGLHIDAIKADGAADKACEATLLIEDVLIHNTNRGVMSILVKDGAWKSVTLRRVETRDIAHSIIIAGSELHPIGQVLIDECPGLRVSIQGEPGTVGTVTVRNSPGAVVVNAPDGRGVRADAKIVVVREEKEENDE